MKLSRRFAALLVGSALVGSSFFAVGASTATANAAPAARIVAHSVLGAITSGHALRIGAVPPTASIRFQIALQIPNFSAEQAFVASLSDRDSPNFHRFLTPAESTARFGPTAASQKAVISWLRSRGFIIDQTYKDRLILDVTGSARQINAAFKVGLSTYRQPGTGVFYAGARNPSIPAALSLDIQNIITDNYLVGHSDAIPLGGIRQIHHGVGTAVHNGAHRSANGNPRIAREARQLARTSEPKRSGSRRSYTCEPDNSHCYIDDPNLWSTAGYDVQALFNQGHCCNPLNNPTTETPVDSSIDIVGACNFNFSDVNNFFAHYGMAYNYTVFDVDGGPTATSNCANSTSGGGFETTLDVEQAVAMSNDYGSLRDTPHVYVYLAPATGILKNGGPSISSQTFFDLWNAAANGNKARVMSMSWGGGEAGWGTSDEDTGDGILTTMAADGYSTMMSAGDSGAYENGGTTADPDYPAIDPATTSVGGTQLEYFNDGVTYKSESAWNNGGGGCSTHFSAWAYQTANGFNSLCSGKRSNPDIALQAGCSPGEAIYFGGSWSGVCGTSDAAPALAGITAMMDAYALSQGSNCGVAGTTACAPLGLLNWYLWAQGIDGNYAPHQPFYDITTGDNDNGTNSGTYPTLTGYDLATGWGSLNALQLYREIDWFNTFDNHTPLVSFGGASPGWSRFDQQVTWTITDPKQGTDVASSGLGGFSQAWDHDPGDPYHDSTPGPGNDTFLDGPEFPNTTSGFLVVPPTQGCHTVNVRVWANNGASRDATEGGLCYDDVAPVTTSITYAPGSPSNKSSVQINGAASDSGCGTTGSCVKNLEYWVNSATNGLSSGVWKEIGVSTGASGHVEWNTTSYSDGVHAIAVDPEDNAGNSNDYYTSASTRSTFVIDRTAPVTTLSINGKAPGRSAYTYPVSVSLIATDPSPGSGVASISYRIDQGPFKPYLGPFKVYSAGAGTHIIQYYSTDKVGNVAKTKSVSLKVKPPAKTYTLTQDISGKGGKALGAVAMNYAGLVCNLTQCVYTGIIPNVGVTFTESPAEPSAHPFDHWVVNGKVEIKSSVMVTMSGDTTVQAVYK